MSTDVWVFTQEHSINEKKQLVVTQTCIYCKPNHELANVLMASNNYEKSFEITPNNFLKVIKGLVSEEELIELTQELKEYNEDEWLKIEISY